MYGRRLFLIAKSADWVTAQQAGKLTRRLLGRTDWIPCYTATSIADHIRSAPPEHVLLRIDPHRGGVTISYDFEGGRILTDLPVAVVDKVYPLPLQAVGKSGLPPDCEEFYKGQRVRDKGERIPTVPSARDVEQVILEILNDFDQDPSIPAVDVAETILDVSDRMEWESLTEGVERRIAAWVVRCWSTESERLYDALATLVLRVRDYIPDSIERLKAGLGHPNEKIRAIAQECLRELGELGP